MAKRSINPEKVSGPMQGLRQNLVTSDADSSKKNEIEYLQLLKLKADLGLLGSEEEAKRTISQLAGRESVSEKLTRKILINLNSMSNLDPKYVALTQHFGVGNNRPGTGETIRAFSIHEVTHPYGDWRRPQHFWC